MPTLQEYYVLLLAHEGEAAAELIAPWDQGIIAAINESFRNAFAAAGMTNSEIPIDPGSSNQSIGNQVAIFFATTINPHLRNFQLRPCAGQGYPDRILMSAGGGQGFPFELKATSGWNPKDSNRRVLTSSSQKLRRHFRHPINHLLATVLYREEAGVFRLESVRLDYLNPDTEVSIRLEGSVSHKLLAESNHPSVHIA
jgi:hypothetical protein